MPPVAGRSAYGHVRPGNVRTTLSAKSTFAHLSNMIATLENVTATGLTNVGGSLGPVAGYLKRRSLVVIISDPSGSNGFVEVSNSFASSSPSELSEPGVAVVLELCRMTRRVSSGTSIPRVILILPDRLPVRNYLARPHARTEETAVLTAARRIGRV